ncbi:hypothetical protein CVD25_09620 [Bacillus canaveralius]|uniref:DUF1659 domain-containing protein n=1 Tax=Bacillus canaveralius TaxID=1403243 RepID=A0A2N5GGJ6_9BACI|nr:MULTISPECIES: DUF1659 domain-containing protein [Bacillus]PLR79852.1 hypothetical protein CU635_20950 [Bacillus canaveralius]PLR87178.1 hypothetical protein CVD23_04175 [Bacillus sp. V33-4]PLR97799.1 hypothetical protein CVD25_09620 [Bacillus canaveralius]RSK45562.1 DUF1659 domain-containing protein [Bacillus canaveralius]
MAQGLLMESRLRLVFESGLNEKGEPIFKTKTYNNIKKEATPDQLYQTALALAGLCADPLSTVERSDSLDIIA